MSPEQCLGEVVDQRSDIYSLGCSMFEALTGAPPFPSQSMVEAMSMHISGQPVLTIADIPDFAPVQAVVLRCLEKRPEDRFRLLAVLCAHKHRPCLFRSLNLALGEG